MKSQKVIGIISIVLVSAVLGFVIYTHFRNKKDKECTCGENKLETPPVLPQAKESEATPLEEVVGMDDFNSEL